MERKKREIGVVEVGKIDEKVHTKEISILSEGDDLFLSYGFSNVKVTKNGVVTNVKLRIKSSGVTELIEEFKAKEPKPPLMDEIVRKDSDMGRQLRLVKDSLVKVPNLGDPDYVKALDEYESQLGIAILQKGLDVEFKNKEGESVVDPDERLRILKSMGMSGPQFTQVVQDIRAMTEWTEEEMTSFFGKS